MLLGACKEQKKDFDASGAFEAEEVMVSAEQTGKILALNVSEGQVLTPNMTVGQIDVSGLSVQKEQTKAAIEAIGSRVNDAAPQIAVFQAQIAAQRAQIQTISQQTTVLDKEIARSKSLVAANAAPAKNLDDLEGQRSILQKQIAAVQEQIGILTQQIEAAKATVAIQNKGILSEILPTQKKIAIIDEQIGRGQIRNLLAGTVLTKYAMTGEFTTMGKPLYKIADLSTLVLRAYISGNQLAQVKLNQEVTVSTDDGNGGFKKAKGIVTWINSKAEFTPKTIQTKDERANMVYAIKITMKNDGDYKIGMYGEVKL